VLLYGKMNDQEKARYSGIINSLSETMPQLNKLKAAFQDILTLKCPTCHNPVDPYPDAWYVTHVDLKANMKTILQKDECLFH
jgi:hypothetical protein